MRRRDTTKLLPGRPRSRAGIVLPALAAFATAYLVAMLLSFLGG